MSCQFDTEALAVVKKFVEACKTRPALLYDPEHSFFKDYLVSLGVTLPTLESDSHPSAGDGNAKKNGKENASDVSTSDSDDSGSVYELELDMDGVIEGDPTEATQDMGDKTKEPTDEERDQSDEKRSKAVNAFLEDNYEEAIKLYTEAIILNPQSSLLFAKRGQVFLKQNKLYACIKDCTRALILNCDSAAAFKFRGRAYRFLGKFEEASHDFCESLKIDYDVQTNEWFNEVKSNAEKLRCLNLNAQRRREEKEHQAKVDRARNAQEARAQAAREQGANANATSNNAGMGGIPGMGGMYGTPAFDTENIIKLVSDPEIMAVIKDPEVTAAFYDISSNPANFVKYQNNPKVMAAFKIVKNKFEDPNFARATPNQQSERPKPSDHDDDVGLD